MLRQDPTSLESRLSLEVSLTHKLTGPFQFILELQMVSCIPDTIMATNCHNVSIVRFATYSLSTYVGDCKPVMMTQSILCKGRHEFSMWELFHVQGRPLWLLPRPRKT